MNEPLVSACGLSKSYGAKRVLIDANIVVQQGEIVGLLGRNGAGKSTLMHCILGLVRYDQGSCKLSGTLCGEASARTYIGFLPEEVMFEAATRCREIVALFCKLRNANVGGASSLTTDEALAIVGIPASDNTRVDRCSHGTARRIAAACAIVGTTNLLILDEPTEGMDIDSRRKLFRYLHKYKNNGGGVLLSSHVVEEVEATCDRFVGITHGRTVDIELHNYPNWRIKVNLVASTPLNLPEGWAVIEQFAKTMILEVDNNCTPLQLQHELERMGLEVVELSRKQSLRDFIQSSLD